MHDPAWLHEKTTLALEVKFLCANIYWRHFLELTRQNLPQCYQSLYFDTSNAEPLL